ncbi:ferritin-like domain-containing protein [uncultured Salinisphaera sp.]|uniref:ferritin-like domain-containing protein n=1 Tax=uncultured Salinisphaera sp. TaxID=359372 RepID=UPI0032B1D2FD|tara:strand:- start:2382 stop:3665 length:1284 start_codon:yes stop_codon:yes gene_type:complete
MTDQIKDKDTQSPIIDASTGGPLSKSRRKFLAHSGMYTAGLVGSALLGACSDDNNVALAQQDNGGANGDTVDFSGAPSDAAVLQFALNLEYLEAEYYLGAVTGMGLQQDDTSGMSGGMSAGTVTFPQTGGVDFSTDDSLIRRYAAEIASDELDHVQFLRAGLESAGGLIARPSINLESSFDFAATAALRGANVIGPQATAEFNPYASPLSFLIGAFIFEDVGVSAYKGGAQFLRNRDFLTAAAGILSVEGYHAGLIRTILTARADDGEMVTFTTSEGQRTVPLGAVINAISDARDSLDGDTDLDQGIVGTGNNSVSIYGTSYDSTNIVPADDRGITYSRTPGQIHNIVYLTPNAVSPMMNNVPATSFFPEGTNIAANEALEASANNAPNDNGGNASDEGSGEAGSGDAGSGSDAGTGSDGGTTNSAS